MAADKGSAYAMKNLGSMYANGRGVIKDEATAAKWYSRAADNGNIESKLYLGDLYGSGHGVPKNIDYAKNLYTQVAVGPSQEFATKARQRLESIQQEPDGGDILIGIILGIGALAVINNALDDDETQPSNIE